MLLNKKSNKVFPYVVVLRQRNRKRVELLGLISAVIFLLILSIRIYEYPSARIFNLLVFVSVSGMCIYQVRQFLKSKKLTMRPVYLVAALSLLLIPPVSGFLLFFLAMALLEKFALMPEEIGFGEKEIVFSGLWAKKISWAELNNVIWKDGIITIDYKNNNLIQRETDDDEEEAEYDATEEEFNDYCEEQLVKANMLSPNQ